MIHAVQTSNFTTEGTQIFSIATTRIRSTREGNVFSLSTEGEGEGVAMASGPRFLPWSLVPGPFPEEGYPSLWSQVYSTGWGGRREGRELGWGVGRGPTSTRTGVLLPHPQDSTWNGQDTSQVVRLLQKDCLVLYCPVNSCAEEWLSWLMNSRFYLFCGNYQTIFIIIS